MRMALRELRMGTIYDLSDIDYDIIENLNEHVKVIKRGNHSVVVSTIGLENGKVKVMKPLLEENDRQPLR
jgi:hypothetical protein